MKELTVDEASSGNVILYKVRVNNIQVDALYDNGMHPSVSWQNVSMINYKIDLT